MNNYNRDSKNFDDAKQSSNNSVEIISDRPSEGDLQDSLIYTMLEVVRKGQVALIEAPPGIGKTQTASRLAEKLHKPMTILTKLTRNQEQHVGRAKQIGVPAALAPSHSDCPCLGRNPKYPNDPQAEKAREAVYDWGWPVHHVHDAFDMPCERGSEDCGYQEQKDVAGQIRRKPNGVLVGNPKQAYNPQNVSAQSNISRIGVFDEPAFESFVDRFSTKQGTAPNEIAQEYVDTLGNFPISDISDVDRLDDATRQRALKRLESNGLEPADHRHSVGEFHAKAPLVTYALLAAKPAGDGKHEVTDIPGGRRAVLRDERGGSAKLTILDVPDLSGFDAVIALDATPCLPEWRAVLGNDIKHYRLLSDDDRNRYLWVDEAYEFVQLHNHIWPASSGNNVNYEKAEAYLREIRLEHGKRPDLVTSKNAIDELNRRGLDNLWDRDMHFGDLRSRNEFRDSDLLVVLGSPSRSDDQIKHNAYLLGGDPEMATDNNGNTLRGKKRNFQDKIANDVARNIHRDTVFQAAMRAGRKENVEATVYIATGMIPEWLETKKVGELTQAAPPTFDACHRTRTDVERAIIEAVRGANGIKMGEWQTKATDRLDRDDGEPPIHRDTIRKRRDELEKGGHLNRRGRKYIDTGIDEVNPVGEVDLTPVKGRTGSIPYYGSNTGVTQIIADKPPEGEPYWPHWKYDLDRWAERERKRNQLQWRNKRGFGTTIPMSATSVGS